MKKHVLIIMMVLVSSISEGQMPSINLVSRFSVFAKDSLLLNDTLFANGLAGSLFCSDQGKIIAADAYVNDTLVLDSAGTELSILTNYFNGLQSTIITSAQINGSTITEGVYEVSGNLILNDIITFVGNDTSVFIVNVAGDLEIQHNTSFISSSIIWGNVFFNVSGNINFSGINHVSGIFISAMDIEFNSINTGKLSLFTENKVIINSTLAAWSAEKLLSPVLQYVYDFGACGLNYTFTNIRLHRRIGGPLNNNLGQVLPANFDPLPAFTGNPIQVFLFYTAVSDNPIPQGHTITITDIATNNFVTVQSNMVGQFNLPTCWGGFNQTVTYVANVPPAIVNSGAVLQLAGIPQTQNIFDVNGASLIVIYQELCTTEWGYISIDAGILLAQQAVLQGGVPTLNSMSTEQITQFVTPPLPVVSSSAFMITGDMETQLNNVVNINGTYLNVNGLIHNFIQLTAAGINQTTTNLNFSIGKISDDCINLSVIGAFYRINDPATCPVNLPTAILTGSQTICSGNSAVITINFTGNPPYTYSYTDGSTVFGPFTTNNTTVQITVNPPVGLSQTVVYTLVNVSNPCGNGTVSGSAVIQLNESPPPLPVTGDVYACTLNPIYCVNGSTGYSYIWTTSWGQSGTGICADFSAPGGSTIPATGGTITFTIIDNSVSPPCSTQTTFSILPCCPVPSTADDFSFQLSSTVITGAAGFQHVNVTLNGELHVQDINFLTGVSGPFPPNINSPVGVVINGVFTVDVNTRFYRIRINLGPDAVIRIMPGITLDIADAWFDACGDYLWNRIELMDNTSGIIVAGSLIEDAYSAIHSVNGGAYRLHYSFFNKNRTAVELSDVAPSGHEVFSSTFSCLDYQLQPATCLPPHQNRRSLVGYSLNNISGITIGQPGNCFNGTTPVPCLNHFINLDQGIFSNKSSVTVYNNRFENITLPPHTPGTNGAAIFFRGGAPSPMQLIAGGANTGEPNRFINCGNGIIARNNVNMRVVKNTFENIQNTLNQQSYCVSLDMGANNTIDVSENSFNQVGSLFSANSGTGIRIRNVHSSSVNIAGNTFNTQQGAHGNRAIALLNSTTGMPANTTFVQGNTIRNMRTGIHLVNIRGAVINDINHITLPPVNLPASETYSGIRLQNSPSNTIHRNAVIRAGNPAPIIVSSVFGISVEATQGNDIRDNNIQRAGSGIRFVNMCGNNSIQCNNLENSFNNVRINNSDIGDQGTPATPNWLAQDNVWTWPGSPAWNINSVGTSIFPVNWYVHPNNPIFFSSWNPLPPSTVHSFPSGDPNTCNIVPARIGKQEEMAAIALEEGNFGLLSPDEQYALKKNVYLSIYFDSTWYNLGTIYDEVLYDFYSNTSNSPLGQLIAAMAASATDTAAAQTLLSTLTPDNSAEENERAVLEIYLATIARGNDQFTSEQFEVLYNIASQHPYSGGSAVYSARAMLDVFFEDAEIESNERKAQLIDLTKNLRKKGKLVPNPARTQCSYIIELDERDTGELMIYDATNIMRNRFALIPGLNELQINLADYPAGVYVYKTVMRSGKQENGKLVIIK